jgi:hypothetical protein
MIIDPQVLARAVQEAAAKAKPAEPIGKPS